MGELGLRSADDHAGQNQMVDVQKQLTQKWDWEKPMLDELDPVDRISAQLNNNGFVMSSSKRAEHGLEMVMSNSNRDEPGLEEVEDSNILVTFDQWGQEMDDEINIHDFGGHLCLKAIENMLPPSNSSTMHSYQADPISRLTKLACWGYFGSALL